MLSCKRLYQFQDHRWKRGLHSVLEQELRAQRIWNLEVLKIDDSWVLCMYDPSLCEMQENPLRQGPYMQPASYSWRPFYSWTYRTRRSKIVSGVLSGASKNRGRMLLVHVLSERAMSRKDLFLFYMWTAARYVRWQAFWALSKISWEIYMSHW